MTQHWTIAPDEVGQRLSTFIAQKHGCSVREAKRALACNLCEVNGEVEKISSRKMQLGDQVTFHSDQQQHIPNPSRVMEEQRVLFEDDHLLIYHKPAGIRTDRDGIIAFVKQVYPKAELVHRLDRDTSGVLIIAKNAHIKELFIEMFRDYQVHKTYLAIVDGIVEKDQGIIENYLTRLYRIPGQSIWGEGNPNNGWWAYTSWECVERRKDTSLVRCFPKTGRTHQIRVHMNDIGHPIIGDHQYGKNFQCPRKATRAMLHAHKIEFPHPVTGEEMTFEAEPPVDGWTQWT